MKKILTALAVLGCILALFEMPDDFYKVLRFVVVAACVAVIWDVQKNETNEKKKSAISVGFGLLAVIFNPILPLEMDRSTWAWFDVGAVVALGLSLGSRLREFFTILKPWIFAALGAAAIFVFLGFLGKCSDEASLHREAAERQRSREITEKFLGHPLGPCPKAELDPNADK